MVCSSAGVELIWPGKYDANGNLVKPSCISFPFRVTDVIDKKYVVQNGSRQNTLPILDTGYQASDNGGWKNKLIWGDNLLVMGSLLKEFAGKIDLIYIDPPFATGTDFSVRTQIGESRENVFKEQSFIEEKAYRDNWGPKGERYPTWIYQRLVVCRQLLKSTGSLYVHLDPTVVHMVKVILDEIFGFSGEKSNQPGFRNELIWCYSGGGIPKSEFPRKHDVILWYTKGTQWVFNTQYRPYSKGTIQRGRTAVKGDNAKLCRDGTPVNDWWPDLKRITSPTDPEKLYFETQKSEELLQRIIRVGSNSGDLVADFFCGSGTTLAVAEKLGRRWIGCDLGRWAIHVTRKRLLGIENCKPFDVLDLGKYERQYWQGVTFGDAKDKPLTERALYEYLAFILELYGAQPVAGMEHIHGKKGRALVHIGAVDAPVTISEIDAAVDECVELKQGELHVLGWEWEMGLYDLMADAAKKKGVKILLLQIPREVMEEQAAAKGDVRFFELPCLKAEIRELKRLTVQVYLKDFVIPNTELIPKDVRSKVKKWSDYIDYWAVNWNFQDNPSAQSWIDFRTRKKRKLSLESNFHVYKRPGVYYILVRVVDIFCNETACLLKYTAEC